MLLGRRTAVPGVPRGYGEHLVFALHVLAFVWLIFAVSYGTVNVSADRTLGAVGSVSVFVGVLILLLAAPYSL